MNRATSNRLLRLLSPLAVVVVGAALFACTLSNPFTSDDIIVATEAPQLYNPAYIPKVFVLDLDRPVPPAYAGSYKRPSRTGLYRPLLVLTYMWDAWLWNTDQFGWRLTSLLLHLLASLMVLALTRRLTNSRPTALVAALLFVAHPIHTEAVAMLVGGRSELLVCTFVCLAWLVFIRGDSASGRRRWVLDSASAFLFLLGLFSKESAGMLPVILFLYSWVMKGRRVRAILIRLIPHFVILIFYVAFRLLVIGRVAPVQWSFLFGDASGWRIAATVATIMLYYLRLILVPYPLQHQTCYLKLADSVPMFWGCLSMLVLACLIFLTIWAARRRRSAYAFYLLLFYACLVPVSHIIPFWVLMAERFLYLPSVAFCLALAAAAGRIFLWRRWVALLGLTVLLASYSIVTVERNTEWSDLDAFWGRVAKCAPNMPGPISLMGSAHLRKGQPAQAAALFRKAISISPENHAMYYNLGLAYQRLGESELARRAYRDAIRLKPDFAKAWNNLGLILKAQGDPRGAARAFEKAVEYDPTHPAHLVNLATVLEGRGQQDRAEKLLRMAVRMAPRLTEARFDLARLLLGMGREEEAEKLYREILKRHPRHAMAHNNLANILKDKGQIGAAFDHYSAALGADPSCLPAHYNLGKLLLSAGMPREAEKQFEIVTKRQPDNVDAWLGLAYARLDQSKAGRAREAAAKAAGLAPADARVKNLLDKLSRLGH